MDKRVTNMVRVMTSVRQCFWLLAAVSDDMIADLDLTASMRAVLQSLDQFGPQTVPQIARQKAVKRQSIQALVDQLRVRGHVERADNPAHRRSVLIRLTKEGARRFAEIRKREAKELADLVARFEIGELDITFRTLETLCMELQVTREGALQDT